MKKYCLIILLFLSACEVSNSIGHRVLVDGGFDHEENVKATPIVMQAVWMGALKSNIKNAVEELRDKNLDNMLTLKWNNQVFSDGTKRVYIQCLFKSSENKEAANKVASLCKTEIEKEIKAYFKIHTSHKPFKNEWPITSL